MDQEKPHRTRNKDHVIRYLASIACLIVAIYSFWTTRDLVVFIVLIGVATGQIGIKEAIGWSGRYMRFEHIPQEDNSEEKQAML